MKLTDELLKSIFDNVRNLILSSVVIAVAVLIIKNNLGTELQLYFLVLGGVTLILGVILFSINVVSAWLKLDLLIIARWKFYSVALLYSWVSIEFVRFLWVGKVLSSV